MSTAASVAFDSSLSSLLTLFPQSRTTPSLLRCGHSPVPFHPLTFPSLCPSRWACSAFPHPHASERPASLSWTAAGGVSLLAGRRSKPAGVSKPPLSVFSLWRQLKEARENGRTFCLAVGCVHLRGPFRRKEADLLSECLCATGRPCCAGHCAHALW